MDVSADILFTRWILTQIHVSVAPCLMFEKPAAYIFSYDTSVSLTEKEKKKSN